MIERYDATTLLRRMSRFDLEVLLKAAGVKPTSNMPGCVDQLMIVLTGEKMKPKDEVPAEEDEGVFVARLKRLAAHAEQKRLDYNSAYGAFRAYISENQSKFRQLTVSHSGGGYAHHHNLGGISVSITKTIEL